jgi:hypothetical protein
MSAAPRLAARATIAGQYYWFNFFSDAGRIFFCIFCKYVLFTMLYILQSAERVEAAFRRASPLNASSVDTVLSSHFESN